MIVRDILSNAATRLQPKKIVCASDKDLGRMEAEILLAHVLQKDRVWLLTNDRYSLPPAASRRFLRLVRRRVKHEPVAYILGTKEFYGRPFHVNKDVLIPRPETELLVEQAIASNAKLFWDVGTGSGAVAISIGKERPSATVIATEASPKAIRIARANARRLGAKNVTFLKADLLDKQVQSVLKDAPAPELTIVANLPYLPTSDKKKLDPDVVKFEPSSALFCGRDGLDLNIRLMDQIAFAKHEWKFKRVTFFLEFDPPQTKQLLKIAKSTFPGAAVLIHKDLAGRDRALEIRLAP